MTDFPFILGIPATNDNPSEDQPDMLINNDSIPGLIAVDHIGFNTANGGYHTVIHQMQAPGNDDPSPIALTNQTYSLTITPNTTGGTADTQLFSESATGIVSQLTGQLAGSTSHTDGWVWSGGMLFQWGFMNGLIPSGEDDGTITFKDRVPGAIPFPNNCFTVQATLLVGTGLPSGSGNVAIRTSSINKNSFFWFTSTNSSNYLGFTWFAVGN
jgi:hypothetical protein